MPISKEDYQVFKFFKDTYTKVNSAKVIKILPTLDILLEGCKNNEYFILSGKILAENILFKYLQDNNFSVTITVEQWKILSSCLKKNIISIDFNNASQVLFTFKNENGNDSEISLDLFTKLPDGIERWKDVICKLPTNDLEITDFISQDIVEIFEDSSGHLTDKHTNSKIIEISKNRILSIQRGSTVYIRYSDVLENGVRFVAISSSTENLKLEQIFATL